jgi:hypothetical protein
MWCLPSSFPQPQCILLLGRKASEVLSAFSTADVLARWQEFGRRPPRARNEAGMPSRFKSLSGEGSLWPPHRLDSAVSSSGMRNDSSSARRRDRRWEQRGASWKQDLWGARGDKKNSFRTQTGSGLKALDLSCELRLDSQRFDGKRSQTWNLLSNNDLSLEPGPKVESKPKPTEANFAPALPT